MREREQIIKSCDQEIYELKQNIHDLHYENSQMEQRYQHEILDLMVEKKQMESHNTSLLTALGNVRLEVQALQRQLGQKLSMQRSHGVANIADAARAPSPRPASTPESPNRVLAPDTPEKEMGMRRNRVYSRLCFLAPESITETDDDDDDDGESLIETASTTAQAAMSDDEFGYDTNQEEDLFEQIS
jgi:hypothetical protein